MKVGASWMYDKKLPIGSFYFDKSQFIWRVGEGTPIAEVVWTIKLTDADIEFLQLAKIDHTKLDCRIGQHA